MSGYAVSIDLAYSRMVQGPHPKDGDPEGSTYPDYSSETYLPLKDGPPPHPIPLPPTAEELIATAVARRDGLISEAGLRINPLQDAVDLSSASNVDITNLKLWKQYRIDLSKISDQAGFPESIDWPTPPY